MKKVKFANKSTKTQYSVWKSKTWHLDISWK